jgi:hypothetical protein
LLPLRPYRGFGKFSKLNRSISIADPPRLDSREKITRPVKSVADDYRLFSVVDPALG